MKISLNTMKQLTGLDLKADEVVAKINQQLGQVEAVFDMGEKYKGVVIAKVVTQEKHPNADKLSFCRIDDGGVVEGVARDKDGLVEVVCGAPNVRAGLFVAWLPPKSTVPSSFADAEPFVLDSRELRGILSHGMIASAKELDLGDDHNGIIEITQADLPASFNSELKAGLSFAEVFGLDDMIIELENKMFTHRPDCFGQLGVAREISGIFGHQFTSPEWYLNTPAFENGEGLKLEVINEAGDKCPRFSVVAMDCVDIRTSPLWLQIELTRWGGKAINNVVDITNWVMLMTGQPVHAYDYDKLRGHEIGVRMARKNEKAVLLNGKDYQLDEDDIVIVDGGGVIGLGGVMGGLDSEVTPKTTRIVLEVANFDMYAIRKTSMRHGIFTDAVTRFNKGQSPLQNGRVLLQLMRMLEKFSGAKQASSVSDFTNSSVQKMTTTDEFSPPLSVKPDFINQRLGLDLSKFQMVKLIGSVEFPLCEDCGWNPDDKQDNEDDLHINVPFWRTDIELPEDIVEEVGRLYGFDKLKVELPRRSISPAAKNQSFATKQAIRDSLKRAGANEVLTYSFVHENTLKKAEQDISEAFQLSNALSPDLQYYRLTVLPSLLDKVHANIKTGHNEFVLFEIGKGHNKKYHLDDDEGLPKESQFVDAVYASKKAQDGAAYFHIRKLVTALAHDLGFTLRFKPVEEKLDYPVTAPFDLKRSALVETRQGEFIGIIGELKQSVIQNFKLPEYTAALSLDFEGLMKARLDSGVSYQPLSRFPKVTQDISLKVSVDTSYEDLFWQVWQSVEANQPSQYDTKLEPLSIYQSKDDAAHKTVSLRLSIASYEKTLTDKDVNQLLDKVAADAKAKFSAERI